MRLSIRAALCSVALIAFAIGPNTALAAQPEHNAVSVGTIRSQTKAIFAKTQTHRQAELIGLLTRLALISEDEADPPKTDG